MEYELSPQATQLRLGNPDLCKVPRIPFCLAGLISIYHHNAGVEEWGQRLEWQSREVLACSWLLPFWSSFHVGVFCQPAAV